MSIFGIEEGGAPAVPITVYPRQQAWSFSAVKQHAQCPFALKLRRIDRLQEPENQHITRGHDYHAAMANYLVNGPTDDAVYPDWMTSHLLLLEQLRAAGGEAEVQQGFDREWMPTTWFGPDVWVRVVFDVLSFAPDTQVVYVTEWKTGKVYPEHQDQMLLYGLAGLMKFPHAHSCRVNIVYLDNTAPMASNMVMRGEVPMLKRKFEDFSREFLNDSIYPKRPSYRCRWCHFRANNGGPCDIVA